MKFSRKPLPNIHLCAARPAAQSYFRHMAISMKNYLRYGATLFSLAALFFILPAAARAAIVTPPNNLGLAAYWKFDEGSGSVAHDYSGNGNNGALTNTPSFVTGKIGKALSFSAASTQYVVKASPAGLNTGVDPRTMAAWVKINTAGTVVVPFVSGSCSPNGAAFGIYIDGSNTLHFWGCGDDFQTTTTLTTGVWYYIAITTSNGSSVTVYVNGVAVYTGSPSNGALVQPSSTAYLEAGSGHLLDAANYYFNGSVDELRYYNRELSAPEIAALYQNSATKYNTSAATLSDGSTLTQGLVGYWSMDGSTINWTTGKMTDLSDNGNTAQLISMSTTSSPAAGKIGQALKFDGVVSKLLVPDADALDPAQVTISVWIYSTGSNPSANGERLVDKANASTITQNGYRLAAFSAANCASVNPEWGMQWYNGSSQLICGPVIASTTRVWTNIVFTHDGTTGRLYVNGVLVSSKTASYTGSNSFNLAIGNSDQVNKPFTGSIDDARMYSRPLSASEIKQLYQQGAAQVASGSTLTNGSTLASGLAGYWSFNGHDVTDQVYDRAGGANAYLIGAATSSSKVPGKLGQALQFGMDGAYSYIQTSASTPVNSYSIAGWIRYQGALPITNYAMALAYGSDVGNRVVWIGFNSNGILTISNGNSDLHSSVSNSTAWHYVAATVAGGTLVGYVDGVSIGTASMSDREGDQLVIGDYDTSGSYAFFGTIDEVRVYSRALSAAEVKQLYNLGK